LARAVRPALGMTVATVIASGWLVTIMLAVYVVAGDRGGPVLGALVVVAVSGLTCISCWAVQPVVSRWLAGVVRRGRSTD
jgi:hypothetical protein